MKAATNGKNKKPNDDFIARAERAMVRAGARAMADYKRFGIEPVVAESVSKMEQKETKGTKPDEFHGAK